jgi:hypothetical protein
MKEQFPLKKKGMKVQRKDFPPKKKIFLIGGRKDKGK